MWMELRPLTYSDLSWGVGQLAHRCPPPARLTSAARSDADPPAGRSGGDFSLDDRQYGRTSPASTSTMTPCPMSPTESTRRAWAPLRTRRPVIPRNGPLTTSTWAPS